MKTKNKLALFILILALIAVVFIVIVWPSIYDHQCKNRVYNDMESSLSSVESSNIRIISVSGNEDEGIGYSAGASGVIFDHNDGRYYALTAYHVINAEDADHFIVATALTPSFDEYKKGKGITGHIPQSDYYEMMPEAKVEYQSEKSDLAIISFQSKEELDIVELADNNPRNGDRIAVVGNPDNTEGHFIHSFGKVTSSEEIDFEAGDGQLSNRVLKHSAYEAPGSSGGAVYSEQMQLVGINIGGGTDFFGRFRYGAMIPCEQINECIDEWSKEQ